MVHIELKNVCDLLMICPLSANTLAKYANGISDNLLTCIARAWPYERRGGAEGGAWVLKKPVMVAPAMNTDMFEHPITEKQLAVLRGELGVHVMDTVVKMLMCNTKGSGAMAEVGDIVNKAEELLGEFESKKEGKE